MNEEVKRTISWTFLMNVSLLTLNLKSNNNDDTWFSVASEELQVLPHVSSPLGERLAGSPSEYYSHFTVGKTIGIESYFLCLLETYSKC